MSRCNPAARWGPGTTCDKVANTAATREMEQRLAAMKRDRESVDKMWTTTATKPSECESGKCPMPKKAEDSKYITFRSSN